MKINLRIYLYSSPAIVWKIKARKLHLVNCIARVEEAWNVAELWFKCYGNKQWWSYKVNIRMGHWEIGYGYVSWIVLIQYSDCLLVVMNLRVP